MKPGPEVIRRIDNDMVNAIQFNAEIVQRAIAGDAEALCDLLDVAGATLLSDIERGLDARYRPVVHPEDIFQVTCMEAFLRIRAFVPGGEGSLMAWLRRIAKNNLLDAVKETKREKRPPPAARLEGSVGDASYVNLVELLAITSTTPSRACARDELHEGVEKALRQLPPDYETVIRFCELAGLSGAETAQRMGRSPGAVRMLLARARERLAEILLATPQFQSRA